MTSTLIGHAPLFLEAQTRAKKIAASGEHVLLTGETGTGKELFALMLHDESERANGSFVAVNCAALPEALLESELFGHVKGAFTAAHRAHEGLAAAAHGGTLFLDEIAEMDLSLQAKLLRFLDSGEFRPVGGTETRRSDARIIAATHGNLKNRVKQNLFREDLYYRLAVLTLDIPPLRARKEDIAPLAAYFLSCLSGGKFTGIAVEAAALLRQYPWPGNVRELKNVMQGVIALEEGPNLEAEMLRRALGLTAGDNIVLLKDAPKPLWLAEKEAIEAALRHCGGNVPRAAALLQISPSTLYRRRETANPS